MEHAAPYRAAAGCRELVVNGGFEQAGQSWTQAPNPAGRALVTNFYWKSGQYAADLGGVNSATDRLTQVIALPADVNEITLAYWWALQTEEASTGAAFDRLSVELYQLNGMTRVATLLTVDNTVAESWVWNRASINLTSYRGQTLLRFTASTDDISRPGSLWTMSAFKAVAAAGVPAVGLASSAIVKSRLCTCVTSQIREVTMKSMWTLRTLGMLA